MLQRLTKQNTASHHVLDPVQHHAGELSVIIDACVCSVRKAKLSMKITVSHKESVSPDVSPH